MNPEFPQLPILGQAATVTAPKRSQTEKYGAALYWGIGGLLVLACVILVFVAGVAQNWGLWKDIYILNDTKQPIQARVDASERIGYLHKATPQQKLELALSRVPPDPARYILAESLNDDVLAGNAESYAESVARSPGWPNWLRLQLVRPLAYAADQCRLPKTELDRLLAHEDPFVSLWATYAAALSLHDETAEAQLFQAQDDKRLKDVAIRLVQAYGASRSDARRQYLDSATEALRRTHADSAKLWASDPATIVGDQP